MPVSKDLKIDLSTTQWLVTGYLLAQAALAQITRKAGTAAVTDLFGYLMVGVVVIILALFLPGRVKPVQGQPPVVVEEIEAIEGLEAGYSPAVQVPANSNRA